MCIRDREQATQLYQLADNFVARLKMLKVASVDAKRTAACNKPLKSVSGYHPLPPRFSFIFSRIFKLGIII